MGSLVQKSLYSWQVVIKSLKIIIYIFCIVLIFSNSKSIASSETLKLLKKNNTNPNATLIPVFVHILDINEKRFKTSTNIESVLKNINKTNEIWSSANIFWDIREINFIKHESKNFSKRIKQIIKDCPSRYSCIGSAPKSKKNKLFKFYKDIVDYNKTNKKNGFNVYYLPKTLIQACGIAFTKEKYTIIGQKSSTIGLRCGPSITLAHELGHLIGLPHVNDVENLMSGDADYKQWDGSKLNQSQKKKALNFYKSKIYFK